MIGEGVSVRPEDGNARRLLDAERRIGELERGAGRRPLGFHVTRTTNDSAVAGSGGGSDITWNNVVEQNWTTFAGFTTASALTVPAGGGGLYMVTAGVYWVTGTTGVLLSVTVNNLAKVGGIASAGGTVLMDRVYLSGVARFAAGDTVRLHIFNSSGASITPTAFAGDIASTPLPYLSAWRI